MSASIFEDSASVQILSSPDDHAIVVGDQYDFDAVGGTGPYFFEIIEGDGTIDSASGLFTAGSTPGTVRIRVTDAEGNTTTYSLQVEPPLSLDEGSSFELAVGNQWTFSPGGGIPPYSYSVISGAGNIAGEGIYTAPAGTGTEIIRVTDSRGHSFETTLIVRPLPQISPSSASLTAGGTQALTTADGVPPHTYHVLSGNGFMTGSVFQSLTAGTTIVRSTDARGNTSDAVFSVAAVPAISPSSAVIAVNNDLSLNVSGGVSPYVWSIVSGPGNLSGTTMTPSGVGTVTVRVTDASGFTADSQITVNDSLLLAPSSVNLAVSNTHSFSVTGGVPPLAYSALNGTIDASGMYTAPSSPGGDTVTVLDSLGNSSSSSVTIQPALQISPSSKELAVSNVFIFSASGGVPPYAYSVDSGSIQISTGEYTAPGSMGSATVVVTDSLGNTSAANVIVREALQISPTTTTISSANNFSFTATGGVAPRTYSVVSGVGTINPSSGLFDPGGTDGSAVIRVTDDLGNESDATITINPPLQISPSSRTVLVDDSHTFTASGGVPPYVYSVTAGAGTIDPSSGEYTAPSAPGSSTVRVTDNLGNVSDATVTNTLCLIATTVFTYTGTSSQPFVQPSGCTTLTVKVWGAGGGNSGGGGGFASADFEVNPGDSFAVYVANAGGTAPTYGGAGGGGASAVTFSGTLLAIAGGGGGGGYSQGGPGGETGGNGANTGSSAGGGGATPTVGGSGGGGGGGTGATGSSLAGGAGARNCGGTGGGGTAGWGYASGGAGGSYCGGPGGSGGGGGGGLFGGGGGGGGADISTGGGAGGGGSSWIHSSASNVSLMAGTATTAANPADSDRSGSEGNAGQPGLVVLTVSP